MKLSHCIIVTAFATAGLVSSFETRSAIPAGYYDTVDDSTPQSLRDSLHLIIDDHTRIPYTSSATDTWDVLEIGDEDPDNSSNVIDVYKNQSFVKQGGGNTLYNREHSWPKSYGFPTDGSSNYPFTDVHHLFISFDDYNSSRNNKIYDNCSTGCESRPTDFTNGRGGTASEENLTTTGVWETWSGRRGDVARALMYLDVRYAGGTHGITGVSEPDLILTDDETLIANSVQGSNISVAYMGLKSVLIQWHKDDPVDDFERRRNEAIFTYQGNRNPFIDNPQYVSCVFENNCSGTGTGGITEPTNLGASGGQNEIVLNWTDSTATDLAGYNVYRAASSTAALVKVNTSLLNVATYTDTGLGDNETYYYAVSAVATDGSESSYNTRVSATTDGGTIVTNVAWINEFHYDNSSTDQNEGVEIAGTAGLDLSGWTVIAYNGNGGASYKTINLSGVIPSQQSGFGTLNFSMSGLQNGGSDGLALVDAQGNAVQFISYEGVLTATDGAATGMTSNDVGVSETSSTPVNYSLQLAGSGSSYSEFVWQTAQLNTRGSVNTGQTFVSVTPNEAPMANFTYQCSSLSCDFDASTSTDSDGTIVSYAWTIDSVAASSGVLTSNTFSASGDYLVALTVTDDMGAQDSLTQTVTVEEIVAANVWMNEFHYDNDGTDINEGVEVAGVAGTDLSGWSIVAYNGNGGTSYLTETLSGVLSDQQGGFGTAFFPIPNLQNGGNDGLALVDPQGTVIQFISYEGALTATDGPAAGITSEDVGVVESSATLTGYSLQLTGTGTSYANFSWSSPQQSTENSVNLGQTLGDGSTSLVVYTDNTVATLRDRGNYNAYMTVAESNLSSTVQLNVDVSHPFVGDLTVRLYAPDGTFYNVRAKDRQDNATQFNETYTVNYSGSSDGTWRLRVRDTSSDGDIGTLNSWTLTFE